MILSSDTDVTTMKIHLNELRSNFDLAMREGETFSKMKELHLQIKQLESNIKVLEWDAPFTREKSEPASRLTNDRRYRFVDDPPPLL